MMAACVGTACIYLAGSVVTECAAGAEIEVDWVVNMSGRFAAFAKLVLGAAIVGIGAILSPYRLSLLMCS